MANFLVAKDPSLRVAAIRAIGPMVAQSEGAVKALLGGMANNFEELAWQAGHFSRTGKLVKVN